MSNSKSPQKTLDNLAKLLSDEALAKSDAEILAEAAAEYGDTNARANELRAMARDRIAKHRKMRLSAARQQVDSLASTPIATRRSGRSLQEMKAHFQVLLAKGLSLPDRLTVAARSGESMSDQDWESLIEDLDALGYFDETVK